jgi:hypothetical protein
LPSLKKQIDPDIPGSIPIINIYQLESLAFE